MDSGLQSLLLTVTPLILVCGGGILVLVLYFQRKKRATTVLFDVHTQTPVTLPVRNLFLGSVLGANTNMYPSVVLAPNALSFRLFGRKTLPYADMRGVGNSNSLGLLYPPAKGVQVDLVDGRRLIIACYTEKNASDLIAFIKAKQLNSMSAEQAAAPLSKFPLKTVLIVLGVFFLAGIIQIGYLMITNPDRVVPFTQSPEAVQAICTSLGSTTEEVRGYANTDGATGYYEAISKPGTVPDQIDYFYNSTGELLLKTTENERMNNPDIRQKIWNITTLNNTMTQYPCT